jgi:hypothetical protein
VNKADYISAELVESYRAAHYVIHDGDIDIVIRVNQVSQALSMLMKKYEVDTAAFLTAFNPHSILATAEENLRNQNALLGDVQALGLKTIAGVGSDSLKLWPSESSILVLGISLENAECLADRYSQNAFLWVANNEALINLQLRYLIEGFNQ